MPEAAEQLSLFIQDPDGSSGRTCPGPSPPAAAKISASSLRRSSASQTANYLFLDLRPDAGNLLGPSWELNSPSLGEYWTLNTGASPSDARGSTLSQILQEEVPPKYYLSKTACLGILRRAAARGKELPPQLKEALMLQAGIADTAPGCGMAFAVNQRDEVRDLHGVAGALSAQPGIKQQTFVARQRDPSQCQNPWDTQQKRVFTPQGVAPTLAGADGGGGRNPAGLLFTAAFSAGQGAAAGGIGWQEECAPTLKASESGSNMVPSVLCLNDQGGGVMDCSDDTSGTLRAQEHGHQPLILYENHGIDSRYTGPHGVAPTMSARYGTGGNNTPLVSQPGALCIAANIITRGAQSGSEGVGCQEGLSYTLTGTDQHAVFSFRRLIRRLIPTECERLQGYPDGWTALPGASDSARYKSLGNSVAIPCVDFVMRGISFFGGTSLDE